MSTKLQAVKDFEAASFAGDWEKAKTFFTDDVYYRVGNTTEMRGPQALVDYLRKMLSTTLAISDLQFRNAWETEDSVILELNMKGTRLRDKANVAYPCVDLYRFKDGKIQDWRVYAIEPTFVA